MASFPIFLDLDTRAPLVVGGGELALSKVRLLLKRAAHVDVAVADAAVHPDLSALADAGRITLLSRAPADADVQGRSLVISATTDDIEDGRVSAIARTFGVPVNVPDRPHLCTFSLAAIVDRGTVTVAIGTEGASPVLATHIRATFERELPPRIGHIADLARDYRPRVAEQIAPGAGRRAFWDDFVTGPVADAVLDGRDDEARALADARLAGATAEPRTGRVILVGAGPGDADLITLKGVRALKSADVVVHDGLMGDAVLDHARREAQFISVGKARGQHSRTQAEINALIVALARAGKTVVRLKGGDPSVFGRGGEEIDILRASGIPVEVVPGITAATAAAASLQIPLTQRDISRSVTFISGHAAGDGAPEFDQVDFAALANGRSTLAVYMGLATSRVLAETLIAAGWATTTPVMAASRVSQAGERRIATTLGGLAWNPDGLGLKGPALLLIGEVVSLDAAGPVERLAHFPAPSRTAEVTHA